MFLIVTMLLCIVGFVEVQSLQEQLYRRAEGLVVRQVFRVLVTNVGIQSVAQITGQGPPRLDLSPSLIFYGDPEYCPLSSVRNTVPETNKNFRIPYFLGPPDPRGPHVARSARVLLYTTAYRFSLRRVFGSRRAESYRRCRKLHKENNSCAWPDIVKFIKIKNIQMGTACNAHRKDRRM